MIIGRILRNNISTPNEPWNCLKALTLLTADFKKVCDMKLRDAIDHFIKAPGYKPVESDILTKIKPSNRMTFREKLNIYCNCSCHDTKRKFIL